MSRIRTVKPDLFGSYSLANVSIEARYLFIALFTEADDYGILIDSPKKIAGTVFPHDEKVTVAKVNRWLSDLEEVGCIYRYEQDGGRYIILPAWDDHQRISHPAQEVLPKPSGGLPEGLRPEGKGKERKGKSPLTPPVGNLDPSPAKKLSPRAAGTNPRAIAAALQPEKDRAREVADATAFGIARRASGIHASIDEAHDEFVVRFPGRQDLITWAVEGYVGGAPAKVVA